MTPSRLMRKLFIKILALSLLLIVNAGEMPAQQPTAPPVDRTLYASSQSRRRTTAAQDAGGRRRRGGDPLREEDYAEPPREPDAFDAEEESPVGEFEMVYGFDFRDRARGQPSGAREIAVPFSFNVVLHPRVEVEVGFDALLSRNAPGARRVSGVGDTSVTTEAYVVDEKGRRPSISFIYTLTLPSASVEKNLGSGRVSHLALVSIEKEVGYGTLGADFGSSFAGRQNADGFITTGQLTLSYDYEPEHGFGYYADVAGQTPAEDSPGEASTSLSLKYRFDKRYMVEGGVLVGLTSNASRVGFFASLTVNGSLRRLFR